MSRYSFSPYTSPKAESQASLQRRSALLSPTHNASLSRAGNSIVSNRSLSSINEVTVVHSSYKSPSVLKPPSVHSQSVKSLRGPSVLVEKPSALKTSVLKRKLRPTRPSPQTMQAICAIYGLGYGYEQSTKTYGRANGMGILLNEHLCLTSTAVLPDEATSIRSFAQFKSGEVVNFDPYRCFVVSSEHGFTVVAFQARSQESLRSIKPISITAPFELEPDDPVFYFPFDYFHTKRVTLVNEADFTFTSGIKEDLLPGTPIFNVEWVLQGVYMTSQNHVNQAMRLENLVYYLDYVVATTKNPILENFLNLGQPGYSEEFFDRVFFYFEWFGSRIFRYDIDRASWSNIDYQSAIEINFCRNHRLVYLANSSVIILGGISQDTGKESSDVLLFAPQNYYTLSKLLPMLAPRDGPACVYIRNYIYVFGGTPHPTSCERYSLSRNKWQSLASMYYERTDAAASTALDAKYVFIFGGDPLEPSGKTVERYSVQFNHWELLSLTLPLPLSRMAIFPVTNRKLALLGGNGSAYVFIFRIEDMYEMGSVAMNVVGGYPTNYTVEDCGRPLDEMTECVHPCAFVRSSNSLYLMNVKNLEFGQDLPGIVEYSVEYLDMANRVDYSNKPLELLAKMRTPYQTQRKLPP